MRYFCEGCGGMSGKQMASKAMATLEAEYAVVGVLEMFNSSLTVFQRYLPGLNFNELSFKCYLNISRGKPENFSNLQSQI